MWVYIFDGETGEYIKDMFVTETFPILTQLKLGNACEVWKNNKILSNYEDENIRTNADGFAMPVKRIQNV